MNYLASQKVLRAPSSYDSESMEHMVCCKTPRIQYCSGLCSENYSGYPGSAWRLLGSHPTMVGVLGGTGDQTSVGCLQGMHFYSIVSPTVFLLSRNHTHKSSGATTRFVLRKPLSHHNCVLSKCFNLCIIYFQFLLQLFLYI